MKNTQIISLVFMAMLMVFVAMAMGRWAEQINPDGIEQVTTVQNDPVQSDADALTVDATQTSEPRDPFAFGASLGLLGISMLYCCVAFGLLIKASSKGLPADAFIYCIAGIAATGFALSYLVDDYFL